MQTTLPILPTTTVTAIVTGGKPEEDINKLVEQVRQLSDSVERLRQELQLFLTNVYTDLAKGKSTHQVFASGVAPGLTDLDVGEIAVYRTGVGVGQTFLYTRTNDGIKYFTNTG